MMQPRTRVLLLEDHKYFAVEIREFLEDDCGYTVVYAANYADACRAIKKYGYFDYALLDILLQNGKTGVDLAEKYSKRLGRIMFITGCVDETILSRIDGYASASKLQEVWTPLEDFLAGKKPQLDAYESSVERVAIRASIK